MNTPVPAPPDPPSADGQHELASRIVASATLLALLYLGREVLMPITLAVILSLVIFPLVRILRRIGLGQMPAVLAAVSAFTIFMLGLATVIGLQIVHVASSMPQYEETIHSKIKVLREMTIDRITTMQGEAGRVIDRLTDQNVDVQVARSGSQRGLAPSTKAVRVEIQEAPTSPLKVIGEVFSSVWGPLQTAGIVLFVLVFVLLEHEALRDRFIRLVGSTDLRTTTTAINDAGERLSRYFASQFAVNFGVGVAIWLGLAGLGFPQATLWAALTAVLRFVPYVGIIMAASSAGLFAAAVDPGWSLMIMTLVLYVTVETIASQLVEPKFYGHTTGLSPLSVVIAMIFWSWLWGPVGLILSIPLTLCLVVAGRHVKALGFLDILLGDVPALTMPQRFYQRALSGDSDEIILEARLFLKKRTFAAYCDSVLMPALHLARLDMAVGTISENQQLKVRGAIVRVIEALGSEAGKQLRKRRRSSVLDLTNPGRSLRRQREDVTGPWQGPLSVPAGSVVLGVGLGSVGDDLATEILVRVLRDLHIDARHLSMEDFGTEPPPGAVPASVAMVCIVSIAPDQERETGTWVAAEIRRRFPEASIVAVLLPGVLLGNEHAPVSSNIDLVVSSFEEAAQQAIARIPRNTEGTSAGVRNSNEVKRKIQ